LRRPQSRLFNGRNFPFFPVIQRFGKPAIWTGATITPALLRLFVFGYALPTHALFVATNKILNPSALGASYVHHFSTLLFSISAILFAMRRANDAPTFLDTYTTGGQSWSCVSSTHTVDIPFFTTYRFCSFGFGIYISCKLDKGEAIGIECGLHTIDVMGYVIERRVKEKKRAVDETV